MTTETMLRAAAASDPIKTRPRRVTGFHVVIESEMDIEDVRASLEGFAERSAFALATLVNCGAAKDGGRFFCAEFALNARNGAVGDAQIFALIRAINTRHRWNGLEKRLAR